ncbi:hypothetical protein QOT17_006415 [Balamuthia mandrillaris]
MEKVILASNGLLETKEVSNSTVVHPPGFALFLKCCVMAAGGLDGRWVEHDSDLSAHSAGRQVVPEPRSDSSAVSVGVHNLSPDNADLAVTSSLSVCTVDVSNPLALVELCVFLGLHTLNLYEGHIVVLVVASPVEVQEQVRRGRGRKEQRGRKVQRERC